MNFVWIGDGGVHGAGGIGSDTNVVVGIAASGRVCAIDSLKDELVGEVYVTRWIGSRGRLLGSSGCLLRRRRCLLGSRRCYRGRRRGMLGSRRCLPG